MGEFYSTLQVYNKNTESKEKFYKSFISMMKKFDYEEAGENDFDVSYNFTFSKNNKWITLDSDQYCGTEDDMKKDAGTIANALKTCCIFTSVVDGDLAIFEMYDKSEEQTDEVIAGDTEAYSGSEGQSGEQAAWEPYISEKYTWKDLKDVFEDNQLMADSCISKVFSILGMSEEENKSYKIIFFKRSAKVKKVTLNAAFKKIYGEYLETYGFKLVKSRYPYFVRVVNNEVVQVISYKKSAGHPIINGYYRSDYERYELYAGNETIYHSLIDFNKSPMDIQNQSGIDLLSRIYQYYYRNFEEKKELLNYYDFFFPYKTDDNESMTSSFNYSLERVMPFLLKIFNQYTSINDFFEYYMIMRNRRIEDVILITKRYEEYRIKRTEELKQGLEEDKNSKQYINNKDGFDKYSKIIWLKFEESMKKSDELIIDEEKYSEYIKQINDIKNNNLIYLCKSGIKINEE